MSLIRVLITKLSANVNGSCVHAIQVDHCRKKKYAEAGAAQDILQEGLRYLPLAETLSLEGRPEQEIIQCASEWQADLIVICPRTPAFGGPVLGPKSVGHVARFVLDRAPCPVLLLRQYVH